ncbi:High-affinity nickel-transport protein [Cedecea neteri]|uniref:High-affinity nickel-transport protein n=1 Tax=Cedecea neteri TaxID=158822 RepID=A0A2X3J6G2_9ENTR|nr:High-affinity nickel-transport protein [Cedecea neteri]
MVLLFSKVIGVFGWGVLSALAMAAGTSITISGLALLVHSFRALAVRLSGNRAPVLWRQVGWSTLALAGGRDPGRGRADYVAECTADGERYSAFLNGQLNSGIKNPLAVKLRGFLFLPLLY